MNKNMTRKVLTIAAAAILTLGMMSAFGCSSPETQSGRDTFFSIWDIFFSDESQSFSLAREMCIPGTIGDIYGMQAP